MMNNKALALLGALAASVSAQGSANIRFGSAYSLGATNSYIVEAETTMYPGKPHSPAQDRLALWPGMGTDSGDLIQAIVLSSDKQESECGGTNDQWCVFASYLSGEQKSGKSVPVDADAGITIKYAYDDSTQKYTQTVTVDGEVISTIESSSGKAIGWGTAVEAQNDLSGTVTAHTYEKTTIKLAEADMAFKDTLVLTEADATELTTTDNGKTWTIEKINIHDSNF